MNCEQAKAEIALWVGNDLNESAKRSLRRHLSRCPGCRKHWRRMKASIRVLQESREDFSGSGDISLWPRVSAALATADERNSRRNRFNGWVPAMAVAVACLMMFLFSNNTPPAEGPIGHRLPLPSLPAPADPLDMSVGSSGLLLLSKEDPFALLLDPSGDTRRTENRRHRSLPEIEAETRREGEEDR